MGIFASQVQAEQKADLGSWEVHYIAINSTFLTPEIAKHYGILRSKYNAVINISVLDKQDKTAQSVVVTGEAKNLLGVVKKLSFKKVTQGGAIYYLAPLSFSDLEQYRMTVNLNDGTEQETLKFQHKFYAE
ncbi:DUF4426 domain-containing protein [Paraglaciecola sp. 2405UD69-4]|uniref:DUF4426 domain-containing protein n=1 Tax=Paraglaciecola sp. 2405UD69-4 TaxID=3391836 RepID=UPI0039C90CD3